MSPKLPGNPTATQFADTWIREVFAPAVKELAGQDGRITASELADDPSLKGVAALALDEAQHLFETQGQSSVEVQELVEAARRYALSQANVAAGQDGHLSVQDALMLPAGLQDDLSFLQTEELNKRGYRFSKSVFQDVATRFGVKNKQALLDKAIELGDNNRYLNRGELTEAAESMKPAKPPVSGFRWTPSVVARVMRSHGLDDEEALLKAATGVDDGNRYLKRSELEEAARLLTSQGPELGIVSDLDKTIIPKHRYERDPMPAPYPGVTTLMQELEFGRGGKAGDMNFVTARSPDRVVDVPDYLETHGVPEGPIETGTTGIPWIAQKEKIKDVSHVFDSNPDQSFVLFGDSSHRDPEVYKAIKEKYGDRVKAVFIHKVTNTIRPDRTDGMHLITNYAQAAALLFQEGHLDETSARRVMKAAQGEGLTISDAEIEQMLHSHRP